MLQRGDPVIAGPVMVGEDDVEGFLRQRGFETVFAVDEEDVAGQSARLQSVTHITSASRRHPQNGASGLDVSLCRNFQRDARAPTLNAAAQTPRGHSVDDSPERAHMLTASTKS